MLLENKTIAVMKPFLGDLASYRHGSRIARDLKINQKTVSNILNRMERENLLKSRKEGKNRQFSVDFADYEKTVKYLLLFETAAAILFLEKNPKIKEIIRKIMPFIRGITLIFGSYAKGTDTKSSDLDILVVGTCSKDRIRDVSEIHGIDISIRTLSEKKFISLLESKDIFIKEAISGHILISEAERYLRYVLRHYYGR